MKTRVLSVAESNVGLTPRQRECMAFVRGYPEGRFPTYSQIAKSLRISGKGGAHRLVAGLIERGHLRRVQFFVVERKGENAVLVPMRNKCEPHVKQRQSGASKLGWRRRRVA